MKQIHFSISFFFYRSFFSSLFFLFFSLSLLVVVSPLAQPSQTTTLYPRWAVLGNIMGVKGSSVMERPSESPGSSVIGFSILCLFSKITRVVNYIANRFAINGKCTVGWELAKSSLALFINFFRDAKRRSLVIWPTGSGSKEMQYKFYTTSNP